MHAGQACILNSRLLLPDSIHDDVVIGWPNWLATLRSAIHATRPCGGAADQRRTPRPRRGFRRACATMARRWLPAASSGRLGPRLLLRADDSDRRPPGVAIAQEEVFGPVLSVLRYRDDDDADDLPDRGRWKKLKRIGIAISDTVRGGKPSGDVRYYILSKRMSARSFGAAVRGHWGIENRLHWQLDVTFGEDHCRTRERTRRRQLQHPPPHGPEPSEEREDREGWNEEQAAHCRLE